MPLPDIPLDNRRFDQLVEEARQRIPGYTPEWTDLNPSDPGMTLVDLMAWLAEMILWRLNRVPEKNFIKFLELIGIEQTPPTPATAELTFKLTSKDLPDATLIRQGTRVALVDQVDGGPVIFETDDNLYAVGAELKEIQSFDGTQFERVTDANRIRGPFYYAFGPQPRAGVALYLGFDRPFPPGRHSLTVHAYTDDLIRKGLVPFGDVPSMAPPVNAVWEYWAGDIAKWKRLTVVGDGSVALTRTGKITFEAPADARTTKVGLLKKDEDPALYWFRYRIDRVSGHGYELPPRLEDLLLNTVNATNAETVVEELLEPSDGLPDQTRWLSRSPVLPDTLELDVREDPAGAFEPWAVVRDFAGSRRDDRHYTLDFATGTITFGDGQQGKIPARDAAIRARRYRAGGGARGNAGPGKITSLLSAVPFVDSVANVRPATGGQDLETVESAKRRGPQALQSQSRAVTADDFKFLAEQTPGARIRRAQAFPLRDPRYHRPGAGPAAEVSVPGVVTVVVVPESQDPQPMPTPETLALVERWLNEHRLITTEVRVAPPRYRRVEVEARVVARSDASSAEVEATLQHRLLDFFHPLRGGDSGEGWEFGHKIYFSEVYRQIFETPGVLRVEAGGVVIYVDDHPQDPCADIELEPDELVYSERHRVVVSYT